MTQDRSDLLHGTLERLILQVLSRADAWPGHRRIRQVPGEAFPVNYGSRKASLQKMTERRAA